MKNNRRRTAYLLSLVIACCFAAAPSPVAATETAGGEVRFEGLKRTRPEYLRRLVRECLETQGNPALDAMNRPELEQCLANSELFSAVRVTVDRDLLITVRERWTLIPLPYFRSQEDSTNYGIFLFESNFLGRGQRLGLGATFGSRGNSYLFFHRDPSVAGSKWTSMLFYRQEDGDLFRYSGDVKVDGYDRREKTFTLAPGYRLTPYLEGRWLLSYADREYDRADTFETFPENYSYWSTGPGVKLDTADFKLYFREGHKLDLRVLRQFARSGDGDPALSYELEWDWHRSFVGRSVLKLHMDAMGVEGGRAVDGFQTGGRNSLRGVQDKGLWAQHLAGLLLECHLPFRAGRFGTWAAGPFISYARYKPSGESESRWRDTLSYGFGVFLYLRKVAIPGIGFAVGRNDDFSGNFVSFQVGFSY